MFLLLAGLLTAGCSWTLPIPPYVAQNPVQVNGSTAIGEFIYQPYLDGKVQSPTQINSDGASGYADMEIAEIVKRATAQELEKSGIILSDNANYRLSGNVMEFSIDYIGWVVTWSYSVKYIIEERLSRQIVFEKVFTPTRIKTSKFSFFDHRYLFNKLIAQGYLMFIETPGVKELLKP